MGDDEDRLTDVVRKFGESPDSYDGMVTTMEKPNNDQSTKVGVVTSRTCLDIWVVTWPTGRGREGVEEDQVCEIIPWN